MFILCGNKPVITNVHVHVLVTVSIITIKINMHSEQMKMIYTSDRSAQLINQHLEGYITPLKIIII